MWETQVPLLGGEDPLEKEMVIHSSILAWKIPWTEEPGRLPSIESQRVRHSWATSLHFTLHHHRDSLSLWIVTVPVLASITSSSDQGFSRGFPNWGIPGTGSKGIFFLFFFFSTGVISLQLPKKGYLGVKFSEASQFGEYLYSPSHLIEARLNMESLIRNHFPSEF